MTTCCNGYDCSDTHRWKKCLAIDGFHNVCDALILSLSEWRSRGSSFDNELHVVLAFVLIIRSLAPDVLDSRTAWLGRAKLDRGRGLHAKCKSLSHLEHRPNNLFENFFQRFVGSVVAFLRRKHDFRGAPENVVHQKDIKWINNNLKKFIQFWLFVWNNFFPKNNGLIKLNSSYYFFFPLHPNVGFQRNRAIH